MAYNLKKSKKEIEAMDIEEIIGWIAYDQIEPMGNSWEEHADLCVLITQLTGSKKFKREDFIPKVKEKKSEVVPSVPSDAEIRGIFASMQRKN